MIVVDGNDGTGKSTLVETLRKHGYVVQDRGVPSKATLGEPLTLNPMDGYLILDAPVETSRERLAKAGKDLEEEWHTVESLTLYREAFKKVAAAGNIPVIDATEPKEEVFADARYLLKLPYRPKIGIPKARNDDLYGYFTAVEPEGSSRIPFMALISKLREYRYHTDIGEFFFLKPRSIPQMVALGMLDAGFVGKDLVVESRYKEELEWLGGLPRGKDVRIVVAAADPGILESPPKRPLTIATEYPNIASTWAMKRGLAHIVVHTWGSTEAYAPAFCDIVIDCVETGATLKANGLVEVETIMTSRMGAIIRKGSGMRHHTLLRLEAP